MSRIASKPIDVPANVEVALVDQAITVKGPKGTLSRDLNKFVNVAVDGSVLTIAKPEGVACPKELEKFAKAIPGTMRALINNMVTGVSAGFSKKLLLVGVGYRAQVQGKVLNLSLGFSHPVNFAVPEGITIETPDATTIIVSGIDKQLVGQVAANIRQYRPPEPYKGKGVRYADEHVRRKESKKK